MSDARGAHPGCPGHAALASRSAGVRDAVRLSSSTDPRKPINIKRRLIIWEGNCGSVGPLILLGVAPLLLSCQTRGHFLVYSPLPFCKSAPPRRLDLRFCGSIYLILGTKNKMLAFVCRGTRKLRCCRNGGSRAA